MSEPVRLQKLLAQAGFGSRRSCETLIEEGRVMVDGTVVRTLGSKADPETQTVTLDGERVAGPGRKSKSILDQHKRVYYLLNKPKGVLCTNEDPDQRPLAVQLIPEKRRIFPVGRLDLDTEGLLILTNDGELTQLLTHPKYKIPKLYLATVDGRVDQDQLYKLRNGVHLAEGKTTRSMVRIKKQKSRETVLELEISEGMNRQIRRMLAAVGLKCRSLRRVQIGPLRLGAIPVGAYRMLSMAEVEALRKMAQHAQRPAAPASQTPALAEGTRAFIQRFKQRPARTEKASSLRPWEERTSQSVPPERSARGTSKAQQRRWEPDPETDQEW